MVLLDLLKAVEEGEGRESDINMNTVGMLYFPLFYCDGHSKNVDVARAPPIPIPKRLVTQNCTILSVEKWVPYPDPIYQCPHKLMAV